MAGAAHLRDSAGGGVRQLVPRNGSPLGDRKRLAAMIAPQVHVMVRDQGDGKSMLVAIEAGEPLENRLELPRSLGSKVHAASLSERDRESVVYGQSIRPPPQRVQHRFTSHGIGRAATGSAGVWERRALTQAPGPQPGFGNEGDRMTDKEWADKRCAEKEIKRRAAHVAVLEYLWTQTQVDRPFLAALLGPQAG